MTGGLGGMRWAVRSRSSRDTQSSQSALWVGTRRFSEATNPHEEVLQSIALTFHSMNGANKGHIGETVILKSAHIKNFRSVRDVQISFASQTAILGPNGAGKSTILKALERFYGSSTQVSLDDFFARNIDEPIEIALTFKSFSDGEKELFGSRIHADEMTVVRVFEAKGGRSSGRFYGSTRAHDAFGPIRNAENLTAQRAAYNELRSTNPDKYGTLLAVNRADAIEPQLLAWEQANSADLQLMRDDGQFLGFTNVAKGQLNKATNFVFIPAVRDAGSDALDDKRSPIAKLMELVVRSAVQKRTEIQKWQEKISAEYRELTDPAKLTELGDLAERLTATLRTLYDETAVELSWKPTADFSIPLPTAEVAIEDSGYSAPVDLQGNGLQRAFILTLLQLLAMASVASSTDDNEQNDLGQTIATLTADIPVVPIVPGLILAIEEPELYQHPTKQRHFAKVLSQLSEGALAGVAAQTQVIFASHSPYFVCLDRFDQIRLARRKRNEAAAHKECQLCEARLDDVVAVLGSAWGAAPGSWTASSLKSKLHIVTSELSEGFFADVVLLVEGESDKAALKAAAAVEGIDFEALGIALLHAGGKNNLDRPTAIFSASQIPVYVVWDCDRKPTKIDGLGQNHALQKLLGSTIADIVDAAPRVTSRFACFETNLEQVLRQEFGGDPFDAAVSEVQQQFGVANRDDAIKASPVMRAVFEILAASGSVSGTLKQILNQVIALRGAGV
jgi:putative ATP-dependent endonuclease of OLD family